MDGDSAARKIRIGHAEREDVIEKLRVAAGEGRLSVDELTERIEKASAAKTFADLDPLVEDLPVVPPSAALGGQTAPLGGPAGAVARTASGAVIPTGNAPGWNIADPLIVRAGWEDDRRRGRWQVPPFIRVESTGATVELSFLEVDRAPDHIHIDLAGTMGACLLVVPDGWGADISAVTGGWGTKRTAVDQIPGPGLPLITVRGSLGMSSLTVRYANWFDRRRLEKRI